MFENYFKSICLFVLVISIQSCAEDDKSDSYVPVVIETSSDFAEVVQNNSIQIDVLANDTNVPASGSLADLSRAISQSCKGGNLKLAWAGTSPFGMKLSGRTVIPRPAFTADILPSIQGLV